MWSVWTMTDSFLSSLNLEGESLGSPATRGRPRRHKETPGVRRSKRISNRYDAEARNGCSASSAFEQESGVQQLEPSCAGEAVPSDRCAQFRRSASDTLTRRMRSGRGCRSSTQHESRPWAGRLGRKSSTKRDSRYHSTSESSGNSDSEVDSGECNGCQGNTVDGKDTAHREAEDSRDVSAAPSSPRVSAERVQVGATGNTESGEAGDVDPHQAKTTALPSSPPDPLEFLEAVDPFPSCPPPRKRSVFYQAFSCAFLFTKRNAPGESSPLPSFVASLLSLLKKKLSLTPPTVTAPVSLLLLFACVAFSLRLLLLLLSLRDTSFQLLTQRSYVWSPARTSAIRYCPQSEPLDEESRLPVVDKLPVLPLSGEGRTSSSERRAAHNGCHPCPEHAVCSGGHMKCLPQYVRIPATAGQNSFIAAISHVAKKLFRREVHEGDICIENLMARRAAEETVEHIVLLLRKRAGDVQCGSLKMCDKLSPDGQTCINSTESRKNDSVREQEEGSKNVPTAADGTMTRWELLQSEEVRQQLEDDSVYAYVFDRFLEETAARRLNVKVKQHYSFESMKLPREDVATPSASKGVNQDGVVAFFLREQRRSRGITYSYTYVGPHAVRSLFCSLRLIFLSTLVPFSVVVTAFAALALPVAVWLRRLYLRRQLLILMQQQQGEQETLMKSRIRGASEAMPVVYCGCSSAHLSQLLVQQTINRRFSLVRWWLQRTATKIEEVDALCFELLHNESACVRRVSHEGQNFWWVGKDISLPDQPNAADGTTTNMCCPQVGGHEQTQRPSTPLSRSSCPGDCPAGAPDSLLSPQFSMSHRVSSWCTSSPSGGTRLDMSSPKKCECNHTGNCSYDRTLVPQADAYTSAMRCRTSIPGSVFAASTGNNSTTTGTLDLSTQVEAISPLLSDSRKIQCGPCTSSNTGCFGQHALSSNVAGPHPITGQAGEPRRTTEVGNFCHPCNTSGPQNADLGLQRMSPTTSTDYSFSAFLARVSDMQRRTPGRHHTNSHAAPVDGGASYGAAAVGCDGSSIL